MVIVSGSRYESKKNSHESKGFNWTKFQSMNRYFVNQYSNGISEIFIKQENYNHKNMLEKVFNMKISSGINCSYE